MDNGAHKVMTPEEYTAMPIMGWHAVCRDVDGFGGVGVRFLGTGIVAEFETIFGKLSATERDWLNRAVGTKS